MSTNSKVPHLLGVPTVWVGEGLYMTVDGWVCFEINERWFYPSDDKDNPGERIATQNLEELRKAGSLSAMDKKDIVTMFFVGGWSRELSPAQSENFLILNGIKQELIEKPMLVH